MKKTLCILILSALFLVSCGTGGAEAARATTQQVNTIDQLIAAEEATQNAADTSGSGLSDTLMPPTNYLETPPDPAPGLEAPSDGGNFGLGIPTEAAPPTLNGTTDGIDVDLTTMNSNMVYAEVSNMVYFPDEYVGKKIRMDGSFVLAYSMAEEDAYYYACLIEDATACCAQGIEFVREGDFSYPEDYPEVGEPITVTGIFELYTDEADGLEYMHLVDAVMTPGS
ncbi:MAG: hypothetical protein IJP92_07625 [Lachnospiraceae bacterium]|nr:hypothetical protein [Lachnospiraceae bacterium]